MVQSRCGIACFECEYLEQKVCEGGCLAIKKPFWAQENCPVKTCCEKKGYMHCGECENFPCDLANAFAYDPNQGDNGKRLARCKKWAEEKAVIG